MKTNSRTNEKVIGTQKQLMQAIAIMMMLCMVFAGVLIQTDSASAATDGAFFTAADDQDEYSEYDDESFEYDDADYDNDLDGDGTPDDEDEDADGDGIPDEDDDEITVEDEGTDEDSTDEDSDDEDKEGASAEDDNGKSYNKQDTNTQNEDDSLAEGTDDDNSNTENTNNTTENSNSNNNNNSNAPVNTQTNNNSQNVTVKTDNWVTKVYKRATGNDDLEYANYVEDEQEFEKCGSTYDGTPKTGDHTMIFAAIILMIIAAAIAIVLKVRSGRSEEYYEQY